MIFKRTASPKPNFLAPRPEVPQRQRQPIGGLAHEIINQLSVLSLVGSRFIARVDAQSGAGASREAEIFTRSIQEATLLVQQLADHILSLEDRALREAESARPADRRVVRLLRIVTVNKS